MGNLSNKTFTIDNNKVYSSYYALACKVIPDWRLVAISIGIPNNFGGEIIRKLNPPKQLLFDYKNGLCSQEEYRDRYYTEVLNQLNPKEVYSELKGKVILCYCGKDTFCHRQLVLEWLQDNIGCDAIGGEL